VSGELPGSDKSGEAALEPLARASAPGKLILFGEHAVVHGQPALASAVGMRTTVSLWPCQGPTRLQGAAGADERLRRALELALPARGLVVELRSELPLGLGMGSSASLSVALVRAAAALRGQVLDHQELFQRSLELERVFHGQPSGVDNAVVIRGGLLRFQRGPPLRLDPVPLHDRLPVVILDSGSPGDTAAMVARVRARRPGNDSVIQRIGELTEQAIASLDRAPALGALMDENHALLRRLGVSTPTLDGLCHLARGSGALGAKLSGGGGGGVVLALVPVDVQPRLLQAAREAGVRAWPIRLPASSRSQP